MTCRETPSSYSEAQIYTHVPAAPLPPSFTSLFHFVPGKDSCDSLTGKASQRPICLNAWPLVGETKD